MSSLPFLSRPRPKSGLWTPLVVKVKYEGTFWRFNIYILEDGRPDISLNALRYKICDRFKLDINSGFIITYIDEDNDIIDMVDEDELIDALKQRLNPLRLEVSFTGQKDVEATTRSSNETSTLQKNPIPKGNNQTLNSISTCLDEILKKLSELLQKTQIKCVEDPFLKYAAPMPKMAGKMDSFSKDVATASSTTEGCQDLKPCSDTQANNGTTHTLNGQEDGNDCKFHAGCHILPGPSARNDCKFHDGRHILPGPSARNDCKFHTGRHILPDPSAPPLSIETHYNHYCHHGLANLSGPTASPVPLDVSGNRLRITTRPSKMTFQIFHNGVQCDGCGMSPIVGPRHASKIKDNYSLCLDCFVEMGKDDEYIKIVHPLENAPPEFPKEVQCHGSGMSPNACSSFSSKMKDDYDHCYDSFYKMGNEDQYRGVGCAEVANCLRIAHHYDSCKLQHIYREGLAHQGKLFDTWSPVGKMYNQSPGYLNCCSVKDVTVCDGAQLAPGAHFTKIWRLRNSGTLPWPQHTHLVRIGGADLGAGIEVNLEIQEKGCPVDEDFDAVVHFIAPVEPGLYVSRWRLMLPSGQMFGQPLWVVIQVVESSKEGFLPLPMQSAPTIKYTDGNAGSFQEKSKQRLFSVDISCQECVSPHSMKSVQTTKDTDARAASFRGQSKQKLFGIDISLKDSDENAILFDDNMNLKHPDVVTIPDGTSVIEQSREKVSDVTMQDFSIPVTIPDGSSTIEQHRENASGLTVQDSDVPNQLQGVSTDTSFMSSTLRRNTSLYVPVHNASKRNFNVCVGAPCLPKSDTNSYSGKYPEESGVLEQFHRDEVETMGSNQRTLNADIPRRHNHDLQSTSDVLCTAAEWNALYDELYDELFKSVLLFKEHIGCSMDCS